MSFYAKKSLGQNFLKSSAALDSIIKVGNLSGQDTVLEIGPGTGSLTGRLLETGANVVAIEKDSELFSVLEEKFSSEIESGQLSLICGDILELDTLGILKNTEKYKLIANIPYYITGAIIRKFLTLEKQPVKAVLLVQKEVAERIVAEPSKIGTDKHPKNKESLLSISVKVFSTPKYIKTVLAGSFSPAPKVDSAIILLQNINKNSFKENKIDEALFFEILHAGFAHKRKVLRKNLEKFTKKHSIPKELISKTLADIGKNPSARAEELSTEDWLCLTKKILS